MDGDRSPPSVLDTFPTALTPSPTVNSLPSPGFYLASLLTLFVVPSQSHVPAPCPPAATMRQSLARPPAACPVVRLSTHLLIHNLLIAHSLIAVSLHLLPGLPVQSPAYSCTGLSTYPRIGMPAYMLAYPTCPRIDLTTRPHIRYRPRARILIFASLIVHNPALINFTHGPWFA
ncbi:uncharacterized protein B0H18DRAFT_1119541 [Fomitopsis serialis]|uniref:uncharacterized protein n=1 Tax=Fomitopsis serialis TaxID=139415 RepID=UPI002008DB27|nr:uncharacterized protein B0H18DRAFT_1119541 [Neoantrodia serialis]KAH9925092.1 hypothetical protein B0H18DRAFT_1119541 [Neoantrodia serialis]